VTDSYFYETWVVSAAWAHRADKAKKINIVTAFMFDYVLIKLYLFDYEF